MTLRLDRALLQNLDAVVIHLDTKCPASEPTRASVVRELVRHALTHREVLERLGVDPARLPALR